MAQSTIISTKELQRQAELCFEGQTITVMLCSVGGTGYTAESTMANWETVEVTGPGYVRFTDTLAVGSYSIPLTAYVLPNIEAVFTATSTGYTYDTVVISIGTTPTYPHSVITETPPISLLNGQVQTYRISLRQDD
jgi:hypothetical protein